MNVQDFIKLKTGRHLVLMDYDLWTKRHGNLEFLKQSIPLAVKNFRLETLRAAIGNRPQRLKNCIAANRDHFE